MSTFVFYLNDPCIFQSGWSEKSYPYWTLSINRNFDSPWKAGCLVSEFSESSICTWFWKPILLLTNWLWSWWESLLWKLEEAGEHHTCSVVFVCSLYLNLTLSSKLTWIQHGAGTRWPCRSSFQCLHNYQKFSKRIMIFFWSHCMEQFFSDNWVFFSFRT